MNQKYFLVLIIFSIILVSGCIQNEDFSEQEVNIIKSTGGNAMLDERCTNETYVNDISDYIVKGTVTNIESKWNDEKTKIFTYSNIDIDGYVKGEQFENNKVQITTLGGCIDDFCSSVEDQTTFNKGDFVHVRFRKSGNDYLIVCGSNGVSNIS